jgi:DNA polymerase delta subunit 1
MPGTLVQPQRRVLADSTAAHRNAPTMVSPNSVKRRKLDITSSPAAKFGGSKGASGQPKSQFEEDLAKLTQEIKGLKENNAEKDQQWERPALKDFDPAKVNLCFQQIEAEKGWHAGQPSIKLFGVTEVSSI